MSKKNPTNHKPLANQPGVQQSLADQQNAVQSKTEHLSQPHNTKKESLGPNTKRRG